MARQVRGRGLAVGAAVVAVAVLVAVGGVLAFQRSLVFVSVRGEPARESDVLQG